MIFSKDPLLTMPISTKNDTYFNLVQPHTHLVANDLKFTITWELAHLPKSTESHLDQSTDFISGLTC